MDGRTRRNVARFVLVAPYAGTRAGTVWPLRPTNRREAVRHQRSLNRKGGLNKGEFLAHRKFIRSEDEDSKPDH